jgi:hypothetical protein
LTHNVSVAVPSGSRIQQDCIGSTKNRPNIDAQHPKVLALHIGRAAGVLLCIITELKAYFHFDDDGARINERIHAMWNALMPVPEIKELYDERYAQLMKDKRIIPTP